MHEDAEKEKSHIWEVLKKYSPNAKEAWQTITTSTRRNEFLEDVHQAVVDDATPRDDAYGDFARNYNDMKKADTHYGDKYFHAKANCQAAQRGKEGEKIAKDISLAREVTEGIKNVATKKYTLKEQIKDAKKDMKANEFGRKQGRENPNTDCRILVDELRPNGLPKQY